MSRRLTPEGRKGVEEYTAKQLQQFLVGDAVKRHATWLPWAAAAYLRIADRTGKDVEAVYQSVLDEVEQLTGLRRMPVASPASAREIGR